MKPIVKPLVQWLMMIFWRNRYRMEESGKSGEGGGGGGEGGGREMVFNLPLHISK